MKKYNLLLSFGLIASLAALQSCHDNGTAVFNEPATDPNTCVWNGVTLTGVLASECCTQVGSTSSSSYNYNNTNSDCPGGTPYQGTIIGTIPSFAQTASAGETSLGNANSLVSTASALKNGANSAAATAALGSGKNGSSSGTSSGSVASNALSGLGNGSSVGSSSHAGGSGANGAGTPNFDGSFDTSTAAATDSGGANGASAASGGSGNGLADGSAADAAYAYVMGGAGRGGSARGGSGNSWGNGFGDGSDANGAMGSRSAKLVDMGRGLASVDEKNAMGSKDPEDYFTLVDRADSIFKIVERRYTTKAKQWALTDAKALASKEVRVK